MPTPKEQERRPNQLPFSKRAKGVLEDAKQAAQISNHRYTGTKHLLLGLTTEPDITHLFSILNVNKNTIRSLASEFVPRVLEPDTYIDQVGFTPSVIEVIKLADQEAKTRNQKEIKPIDLLTGIVREREGQAAKILKGLGLAEDNISDAIDTYMVINLLKT